MSKPSSAAVLSPTTAPNRHLLRSRPTRPAQSMIATESRLAERTIMPHERAARVAVAVTLSFLIALEATIVAPPVFADEADRARAEQLFLDAKQLMEQGKYVEACPKLEESQRLDPADGTLLRYAWCQEELGKLATAWVLFKDGLSRAKKTNNAARIKFAEEHLAAIEPRLSKVTIHVSPVASVDGLELRWDGKALGKSEWNAEFPVDGGDHTLSASAPGRQTWTTSIGIGKELDRRTIEIPQLLAAADSGGAMGAATGSSDGGSRKTWVYVLAGTGVVFIGGFVGAQLLASSAHDDRKTSCLTETTPTCDDTGKSKVRTWETISFVSAGLALASVGASIYLFTSSPKTETGPSAAFVRVSPMGTGVLLDGAF